MRNPTTFGRTAILSAAIGWLLLTGITSSWVLAQTDSSGSGKKVSLKGIKDSATKPTIPAKGAPDSTKSLNPAPGTKSTAPGAKGNKPGDTSEAPAEESGSMADGLVGFIRGYATWILVTLGGLLGIVLVWAYLSSRSKADSGSSSFAELGLGEKSAKPAPGGAQQRYSSTKIQASDVNNRLSKSTKSTEIETDREYALVVDEESLKMPPLPEESGSSAKPGSSASGRFIDPAPIEQLLEAKNVRGAFEAFAKQIQAHKSTPFQGEVEKVLSERLMQANELEKAAKVLEHHVATRDRAEVKPEAYFNLGYIHFQKRTFADSRRYFKLFVENGKNPAHVARAKKLLQVLKVTPASN